MRFLLSSSALALGALALLSGCAAPAPSTHAAPAEQASAATTEVVILEAIASADAPAAKPEATAAAPKAEANGAASEEAAPKPPTPPRIYAKSRFIWVRYEPRGDAGWTGFLWLGGHADLASTKPIPGQGGCNAWYAVKPRGFVCGDGDGVTLDENDPVLVALRPYAPKKDTPWPHEYGESRGLDRYMELPSAALQKKREYGYEEHLTRVAAAKTGEVHKSLEGVELDLSSTDPLSLPLLPRTLREQRNRLQPLSTVAWSRDVADETGRPFLLTGDLALVPKDRVTVYPKVTFHGVTLEGDVKLPLAFFREKDRPQYKLNASDEFEPTGEHWKRLSHVLLTGQEKQQGSAKYLETRDGLWVDANDAAVPTPQPATPWGAPVGGEDATGRTPAGRATWLEISVLGGWLIAYEGTRPVYTTLIAPGRGGIPAKGIDPLDTASTPVGIWPITGKFVTATMVAPHDFVHSDVPWAQNFHGPHALHGAYWHDAWGEKKSAGCVNLSPIDGKWLFDWTDPPVPDGWHGVRWEKNYDPATTTVVHR